MSGGSALPKEGKEKPEIKVTDKRIFTAEGEIREEFRNEITPSDAPAAEPKAAEPPVEKPAAAAPPQTERREQSKGAPPETGERRRSVADKAVSPATAFANFIEPLIAQGYMFLGMLRDPYQPQMKADPKAARQMIDILTLLQEKTQGNLTPEEADFLDTHLSELKLAYVQRTKNIG